MSTTNLKKGHKYKKNTSETAIFANQTFFDILKFFGCEQFIFCRARVKMIVFIFKLPKHTRPKWNSCYGILKLEMNEPKCGNSKTGPSVASILKFN